VKNERNQDEDVAGYMHTDFLAMKKSNFSI